MTNKSTLCRITNELSKDSKLKIIEGRRVSKAHGRSDLILFGKETN